MTDNGFHWRDGWHFKRQDDGTVFVYNSAHRVTMTIPASEWASIVASVCKRGETGDTYREALAFHDVAGS